MPVRTLGEDRTGSLGPLATRRPFSPVAPRDVCPGRGGTVACQEAAVTAARTKRAWPWRSRDSFVLALRSTSARWAGIRCQDPDEGRYAEIPREMIESGDWVTPRLNYTVYFEKPPLFYWLVALSFEVLGQTEGAARAVSAAAGIVTIVLTFWLGLGLLGPRAALLGAGALAASPIFFVLAEALTIDMVLTACITATLAFLHRAHAADRKTLWVVLVAVASALGVLAKGPVALVLPGLIALLYLLVRRDWSTVGALLRPLPIGLFALIVVPWFVLVAQANPEFLEFFFIREHLQRFAANVGHPEGPLYYVPVLFFGPLPWTAVAIGLACTREGRAAFGEVSGDARLYLLVWGGLVISFFTLASSKLATYILPALPPLALLFGGWLDRVAEGPRLGDGVVRWLAAVLLALGTFAAVVGIVGLPFESLLARTFRGDDQDVRDIAFAAIRSGLAFGVFGFAVGRSRWGRQLAPGAALLLLVAGVAVGVFGALPGRAMVKTSKAVAVAAGREMGPGDLVVLYKKLWQGLPFYTERRVTMIKNFDELKHSITIEEDHPYYWNNLEPLVKEWDSGRRVFLFTNRDLVPEVAEAVTIEPRILARDRRRVVIVNFPPGADARDGEPAALGVPVDGGRLPSGLGDGG